MRDWQAYVCERLSLTALTRERQLRVVRELAAQLEDIYRDAVARGLSEADADALASAAIADWPRMAADVCRASRRHRQAPLERLSGTLEDLAHARPQKGWTLMFAHLVRDVRHAIRQFGKAPAFGIVSIATLALGIGATTAIFSVVYGVLLKPLPYPASDELVGVWHTAPGVNITDLNMGPSNYFVYREQSTTFEDIGLYRGGQTSVTGSGEPERVPAVYVTDGVLPLLRVVPAVGRLFTRDDAMAGRAPTVMLGHGYWLRKFGGDPSVVGRALQIDGQARQVIGVLPREFRFLDMPDRSVALPFQFDRARTILGQFSYVGIARLKPGVTLDQANADVARMLPIVVRTFPAPPGFSAEMFESARIGPNLRPLKRDVVGDVGGLLGVVMGCLAVVLLIACANVANLWLLRLEGRRPELALRAALGAGRVRMAGELLAECLIIGAVSGLIGLGLAAAALRGLVALEPSSLPRLQDITLDPVVIAFAFGIALAAGVLFGVIPILRYAGPRLAAAVHEAGRSLSQSREQRRVRRALVVVQVALALVLLVGAGLMIRSFHALSAVDPGFTDPDEVQVFQLAFPDGAGDADRTVAAQRAILERISAIPGVTAAAVASGVPMDGNASNDPVFAEDRPYQDGELAPIRRFTFIMPGYFSAMGTPLAAGRDLTWRDVELRTPVALVSRNFAVEYWGTPQAAIGKRIRVASTDDWREIIGVAGDVYDDGVSQDAPTTAYWPMVQERFLGSAVRIQGLAAFVVRTPRAGSEALLQDLRQAVWSVNASLPLFSVRTVGEYYHQSLARTSLTLILLGIAGGMALLLAVIGLYGVIAYSVSQRTREIGIRMALGAAPSLVTRMFVRDGLRLAGMGVAGGLVGAWVAVRLMSSLLFGVSPVDPLTYALVGIALIATCMLATYIPSRRAAAVDPSAMLRAD